MYLFFVSDDKIEDTKVHIAGPDVNHIRNVLRMKEGEQFRISNGKNRCLSVELESFEEEEVICRILSEEEAASELPVRVHLFQCLPKADKMELIIQKNVELGVSEIIPVESHRSVVKLDAKKARAKVERWNAISESAAKQSKRMIIPEVREVMSFKEALSYASPFARKTIPYENAEGMNRTRSWISELKPGEDVAVLIGPEGGFEETEVKLAEEAGFVPLTLGGRILRTETAGMALMSVIMFQMDGMPANT